MPSKASYLHTVAANTVENDIDDRSPIIFPFNEELQKLPHE